MTFVEGLEHEVGIFLRNIPVAIDISIENTGRPRVARLGQRRIAVVEMVDNQQRI